MVGKGECAEAPRSVVGSAPTLRSLAPSAFLPCMVYEIANGAIAPVIALTALDLGASLGTAGFMLALLGIGQVLGDLPAGSLAAHIGDRRAMIVASVVAALALVCCLLAQSLVFLGAGLLVIGVCTATFYLARQSYMTEIVPPELRARAMSTLAGSHRIGLFIGPFVGAGAISIGGAKAPYVVAIAATAAAAAILAIIPDLEVLHDEPPTARSGFSTRGILITHGRLLTTLGTGIFAVGMIRASRQTVLPLWAHHDGLSPAQISLIFGISSAADMAMFYPSGKVMDHYGRLAIVLPAMLILGFATSALPLTTSAISLTAVAFVMNLGNGISAGVMMTIGADVAPVSGRTRFLSIWRVMSDTGGAAGPVTVSVVATLWTLAAGIVVIGLAGIAAAVTLTIWTPRYSAYATPKSMRTMRLQLTAEKAD